MIERILKIPWEKRSREYIMSDSMFVCETFINVLHQWEELKYGINS